LKLLEREFEGFEVDVKFRRDFVKLIALVKAHAILRWRDRWKLDLKTNKLVPKGEPRDLEEFYKDSYDPRLLIIAEWEDFEEVYKLMETSFKPTITGFNDGEIRVLEELYRIKEKDEVRLSSSIYSELARRTGIPSSTIRQVLVPRLEKRGFLAVARDRRPHDIDIIKMPRDLALDLSRLRTLAEAEVEAYISRLKGGPSHDEPSCFPATHCCSFENSRDKGPFSQKRQAKSADSQAAHVARPISENKPDLSLFSDEQQWGDDEHGEELEPEIPIAPNPSPAAKLSEDKLEKCGKSEVPAFPAVFSGKRSENAGNNLGWKRRWKKKAVEMRIATLDEYFRAWEGR
jgi:DNA-binding MarR family transcriptional regulator